MEAIYYPILLIFVIVSFALITVIPRKMFLLKKLNLSYDYLIPRYLSFSALFAIIGAIMISKNILIPYNLLLPAVIEGTLYTSAAYIVFYTLSKEQASIIGFINSSQMIFISFFSSLLFEQQILTKISAVIAVALIGIFLMSMNLSKDRNKISKFVWLALLGNLLWVLMWIIFDSTLSNNYQLSYSYFEFLMLFSAITGIILSIALKPKFKHKNKGKPNNKLKITTTALLGLFNGLGTLIFSFLYAIQPALTPLFTTATVIVIVTLSFFWIKEKLSIVKIIGGIIIGVAFILFFV